MQRFLAILVILLAGLSLLVSTEAYQIARPVNPAQVPIVVTNNGALSVQAGPSNAALTMVTTDAGGRLVVNMSTNGLDSGSTTTLYKVIRVTNGTGSPKNVSLTVGGYTVATLGAPITGYINGAASAANQPFPLPNGQYVDINLKWTATGSGTNSNITMTVTGN